MDWVSTVYWSELYNHNAYGEPPVLDYAASTDQDYCQIL